MIFMRHLFVCYLLAKRNNRKRNERKENEIRFEVMCRHVCAYVALKKGNKIKWNIKKSDGKKRRNKCDSCMLVRCESRKNSHAKWMISANRIYKFCYFALSLIFGSRDRCVLYPSCTFFLCKFIFSFICFRVFSIRIYISACFFNDKKSSVAVFYFWFVYFYFTLMRRTLIKKLFDFLYLFVIFVLLFWSFLFCTIWQRK